MILRAQSQTVQRTPMPITSSPSRALSLTGRMSTMPSGSPSTGRGSKPAPALATTPSVESLPHLLTFRRVGERFDLNLKRYNRDVRSRFLIVLLALLTTLSLAQDSADKAASDKTAPQSSDAGGSSSRDTRIDTSPPKDDAKSHPSSKAAVADLEGADNRDTSGIQEFHPWNPMK